jgi:hypothetical protein
VLAGIEGTFTQKRVALELQPLASQWLSRLVLLVSVKRESAQSERILPLWIKEVVLMDTTTW